MLLTIMIKINYKTEWNLVFQKKMDFFNGLNSLNFFSKKIMWLEIEVKVQNGGIKLIIKECRYMIILRINNWMEKIKILMKNKKKLKQI